MTEREKQLSNARQYFGLEARPAPTKTSKALENASAKLEHQETSKRLAKSSLLTARDRSGLTRRELALLLDRPGVAAKLMPWEVKLIRNLGDGNISFEEIGKRYGGGLEGAHILVAGIEREVLLAFAGSGGKLPKAARPDRNESEGVDHAGKDFAANGGGSVIGTAIVPDGDTIRWRPLKDFDTGTTKFVRGGSADPDHSGGETSGSDDYSADSRP
jgi:hypothetical protein